MEKIKIESIESKGDKGLVIVNYFPANETGIVKSREATMNTKWQSQQIDYLEKDVGTGGSVSVLIEQKGEYTNITKVDFNSAEKGVVQKSGTPQDVVRSEKFRTPNEMVATELTVAVINCSDSIEDAVGVYKEALRLLND